MNEDVTYDLVAATADQILATGEFPTARETHRTIDHGSFATVAKFFRIWKEQRKQVILASSTLSTIIQKTLLDEIGRQVSEARVDVEQKLAEEQEILRMVIDESEVNLAQIKSQARKLIELETLCQKYGGRIEQLTKSLDESRLECRREREVAESVRQGLVKAQIQLDSVQELQSKLAAAREKHEAEHLARVDAEKVAAVAETSRNGYEARLSEMKGREVSLISKIEKAQADLGIAADRERSLRDSLAHAIATIGMRQVDTSIVAANIRDPHQGAASTEKAPCSDVARQPHEVICAG